MVHFTVTENEDGFLLEKVILGRYPALSRNSLYKVLRKRDVKIDGARVHENVTVRAGSEITAYIDVPAASGETFPEIIYENDFILLCVKRPGLLTEPDGSGEASLIETVRAKAGYETCELCHRLDRNTGGMVFVSKKPGYTEEIDGLLNSRYYRKFYRALVCGDARDILSSDGKQKTFRAFLFKDSKAGRVFVSDRCSKGAKEIETRFSFISYNPAENVSVIEAELITGRTHQIRAHLAFLGHFIIGDGKYGSESTNRLLGRKTQALWACRYEYAGQNKNPMLPARDFSCKCDF